VLVEEIHKQKYNSVLCTEYTFYCIYNTGYCNERINYHKANNCKFMLYNTTVISFPLSLAKHEKFRSIDVHQWM
jgi:hypothetical protein